MINLFNNDNMVDPLTIVLSSRDLVHLGQLSNVSSVKFTGHLNAANELSFVINKYADDHEEKLWDEIYDLRLLWIKELDEYYEIKVTLSDKTYLEKTITAVSLCEAELSQSMLHNIEINTEADISRDDYDVKYPTVFYRDLSGLSGESYIKAKNSSLMHRILDKVPAYTIGHVDQSLVNLQRTFSISDSSIYDWLVGECSEAFNCLFKFNSIDRTIDVYDLYSNCNTCGHRGNFVDICPECGSTDINYGYGEDTEIFCSTDNLTNQIDYNTDVNSIKNCFRLVAGDDDMTAAVININPNGSQYIYKFSDETFHDMPDDLVQKLHDYDDLYNEYKNTHEYVFSDDDYTLQLIDNYNNLVEKYDDDYYLAREKHLTAIPKPPTGFIGYINLIKYIYGGYELQSYLDSGMMPVTYTHGTVNASTEAAKINRGDLGDYISLNHLTHSTSEKTIESALTNYAKVFVKTGYVKLKAHTDEYIFNEGQQTGAWTGYFTVSNYSDDSDVVDTIHFTMVVNQDYENFMQQKIAKQIVNSTKEENDAIYNVLRPENTLEEFTESIKYYSLARLASFRDALDAVLSVLQEAKQADEGSELYNSQYKPYFDKYVAACDEYNLRAIESASCSDALDMLVKYRANIQDILNFKKFLDPTPLTHYYELLTTYIREDDYNNSNYISDGLDNDQLFANAQEFFKAAEDELIKSSFYQHSISANLYNLLLLKEFEPLKNKFELGNWIRVGIEDNVYRLRLISYSIDYENLANLTTEFSDVTRTADGYNDIRSVIKQAQTMATSYNAVTKQAESGQDASGYINSMVINGLSAVNSMLKNNNNEEITITAAGVVGRSYDDINGTFSDKQIRLTHNILAFTKDNWKTVETALGEITYVDSHGQTINDYGLIAKVVISGYIYGSTIEGGTIISAHIRSGDDDKLKYIDFTDATEDENHNQLYFIKCSTKDNNIITDNLLIDKSGNIKSKGGLFTNSNDSSYLNLNSSSNEFPNLLQFGNNFKIDGDGKITSKSGILINNGGLSYINLSGNYNTYQHLIKFDTGNDGEFYIDQTGNVHSSGGIFSNLNNTCYINFSEDYDNPTYVDLLNLNDSVVIDKNGNLDINNGKLSGGSINIGDGNFRVNSAGNITIAAGMFKQYGNGYLHLATTSDSAQANSQWQFDLGQRKCNCMYWGHDQWNWVNNGAQDIYKYLEGAYSTSDKRYKKDIVYLDAEQTKNLILNVEPCSFKYTYADYKTNFGMLAQDVKEVLDEIGIDEQNGLVYIPDDEMEEQWSIEYKQFVPFLIKMIQIQQSEIDSLKKEVEELKAK